MVGDLLDLGDALGRAAGVIADPLGLLLGDARLTQLGLGLARQHLDLLPDVELVLKRPDMPHLGARVAVDHQRAFPSP